MNHWLLFFRVAPARYRSMKATRGCKLVILSSKFTQFTTKTYLGCLEQMCYCWGCFFAWPVSPALRITDPVTLNDSLACLPDHPFPQCWMCMMYKHNSQHLFSNILYKLWQPTLTKKWLKGWSLVDINIAHSWSTTWPWLQALQEWPPFDPDNGEVWDKESRGWNLWTNGLKLNTVYLCGFNELLPIKLW